MEIFNCKLKRRLIRFDDSKPFPKNIGTTFIFIRDLLVMATDPDTDKVFL